MQASPTAPSARLSRFNSLRNRPLLVRTLGFLAIGGVLTAVWSPFAPIRLFDFDAANFALALETFAPAAHQPQPPGYPLYVALTRLIQHFTDDVSLNFLIAGLLGATAAVGMLWMLGECVFPSRGKLTGAFAALLLLSNPILWQTGMSDQVRIYIAVISVGVALVLWPGWAGALSLRRFAGSCLLLGVLSGFRPEMLVSMMPLILVTALRRRVPFRYYLAGGLAVCVGMAPWFIVLLAKVGGAGRFITMMRVYSAEQAGGTSLLFGAGWAGAWKMVEAGFWWAGLGVAAWLPAALLVRWWKIGREKQGWYFCLVWFFSLFLFSLAVHIAASGHSLGFIPVLCLAGGRVLSAVGETRGRLLMFLCALAALSLNVYFFFDPYSPKVREASYQTVGGIGNINEAVLDEIDRLTAQGSTFLVSDGSWVSWRILQYYYPRLPLLYIPAPFASPETVLPVWLIQNHHKVGDLNPRAELALPSCGTIVWVVSDRVKQQLLDAPGAQGERYMVTVSGRPGMSFHIGRYRLASSQHSCR